LKLSRSLFLTRLAKRPEVSFCSKAFISVFVMQSPALTFFFYCGGFGLIFNPSTSTGGSCLFAGL